MASKKKFAESESSPSFNLEDTSEHEAAPASQVRLRPLGWKKDEHDPKDKPARAMLGAPVALPSETMQLCGFIWKIYNQTITSSCVGQAIRSAAMIRQRAIVSDPADVEELSAQGIYGFAREREKARLGSVLTDSGCFPRDAMFALSEDGIPTEKVWPFDEKTINEEPDWAAHKSASAHRITEFYRIDSEGVALIHDVMNALVQLYPVIFGTFVDTKYMQRKGGGCVKVEDIDLDDTDGGGHMQTIVGYKTMADGIWFLVLNSWDTEWAERGFVWMHQSVLMSKASSDFYVFQIAPKQASPVKEAA